MENKVIEVLLQEIDALRPMIRRAYETGSEQERLFLDQAIPVKLHEIEEWLPAVSIETMWQGRKG